MSGLMDPQQMGDLYALVATMCDPEARWGLRCACTTGRDAVERFLGRLPAPFPGQWGLFAFRFLAAAQECMWGDATALFEHVWNSEEKAVTPELRRWCRQEDYRLVRALHLMGPETARIDYSKRVCLVPSMTFYRCIPPHTYDHPYTDEPHRISWEMRDCRSYSPADAAALVRTCRERAVEFFSGPDVDFGYFLVPNDYPEEDDPGGDNFHPGWWDPTWSDEYSVEWSDGWSHGEGAGEVAEDEAETEEYETDEEGG